MRYSILIIFFLSIFVSNGYCQPTDTGAAMAAEDFSQLLSFIAMEDLQEPLVLFEAHDGDFDSGLNQANIDHLNQNKALLQNIKSRLNGDPLRWKLASSSKSRFVVPEHRTEYASLFENYCRKSIDYVLERLKAPSPYADIITLGDDQRPEQTTDDSGINAYLAHNVVDEYVEEYEFFVQEDNNKKIKIKVRNRNLSSHIGSYSSDLVIGENSTFEFIRSPFTLWQNSAQNPLNVFIVPIEETLHILLRGATETAISDNLKQTQPKKIQEVENLIDHWMAVEEAIVGGMVAQLMPEIFSRYLPQAGNEELDQALAERHHADQYRFLDKGIQMVGDMGLDQAAELYQTDPQRFQDMVSQPELAATELQSS